MRTSYKFGMFSLHFLNGEMYIDDAASALKAIHLLDEIRGANSHVAVENDSGKLKFKIFPKAGGGFVQVDARGAEKDISLDKAIALLTDEDF